MMVWFTAIGLMGLFPIIQHPEVLKAISPYYAFHFGFVHYQLAFITLGAVFLCVTGAEALYADMGHFGKRPIRIAWFFIVMPCLILNYFGQGALVLANPSAAENPFFLMLPEWSKVPMVALATAATVIASQALISGAFSATKQTIQLGYLPRMTILHTSQTDTGQIYVPAVNWALLFGVVMAVVIFRSSSALAAAYGISVSLVMVITTILTFFVIRFGWKLPLSLCIASTGVFLIVDVSFFASNLLKIADGGWFPLMMAAALYLILATWKDGRNLLTEKFHNDAIELTPFLESVLSFPPVRAEGTAVFLNSTVGIVPNAMLHNLKHNKVLHKYNMFLTVQNQEVPRVPLKEQVGLTDLGNDCWQVIIRFGFLDDPDVPKALEQINDPKFQYDSMKISYFLSRDILVPTLHKEMAPWRESLFAQMHRSASGAADFLRLPSNKVVELGSRVEF
jgi:KUP system potassium uptake protein